MLDNSLYRGVAGPVGSGKSTGCCFELMKRAQEQYPGPDGVKRSRFVVVRNTYRELLDTTIPTWQDWFKVEWFGPIEKTSMSQMFRFKAMDQDTGEAHPVEMEVRFRALDTPDDISKVLSAEYTGAWVNEARELPKSIIDGLGDRVGRYPKKADGGCRWRGVLMDTNMPDSDHWWYRMAEVEKPEGWKFFRQPGGLIEVRPGEFVVNPEAENVDNLEDNYYATRRHGKKLDYIRVYYCAQYGFVKEGKSVISEYVDQVHCAGEALEAVKGLPVYVGLDFGLTPAALFGQKMLNGRWLILDELVSEDMGTHRFGEVLKSKMISDFNGFRFEVSGDPAGDQRAQTDERTPFQILETLGVPARKAPSNDWVLRRESIAVPMGRLIDGKPGLMISPKCVVLRQGLAGKYYYKRVQISGEERYQDVPYKNKYSHPVDALGYMLLGAGEGGKLTGVNLNKAKGPSKGRRPGRTYQEGWMAV